MTQSREILTNAEETSIDIHTLAMTHALVEISEAFAKLNSQLIELNENQTIVTRKLYDLNETVREFFG